MLIMRTALRQSLQGVPASTLQVMAKYNALFQHLLRLKRVNGELDMAWASLRRQAGAESLQSRQPLWEVRLHMAHLLLNLQVYMQVCSHSVDLQYRLCLFPLYLCLCQTRRAAVVAVCAQTLTLGGACQPGG